MSLKGVVRIISITVSMKQRMGWLDSITDSTDMNLSTLQQTLKDREAWRAAVHGVTKSWTQLSN